MAPNQGQQTSQSPFKLLSRASWTKGSKKPKQGNLGEENNMYYHPELKRWVERGKEEEAEREAAGPPPPPVLSGGSITSASAPLSKRSLSQRYVLQPNLSISSSMASLAGSLSQTDLAGLAGAMGDSFSGPPSALGSTAPSPPQSSNCLGSFASGPPSVAGGHLGGLSVGSFFVPPPPQRVSSQTTGGFFVPSTVTAEDRARELQEEEQGSSELEAAAAAVTIGGPGTNNVAQQQADSGPIRGDASGFSAAAGNAGAAVNEIAASAIAPGPVDDIGCRMEAATRSTANAALCATTAAPPLPVHVAFADRSDSDAAATTDDRAVSAPPDDRPLSFPDTLANEQVESPVALVGTLSPLQQPLVVRAVRRLGSGGVVNPSDGGVAISLHEGMGFLPAGLPDAEDEGAAGGAEAGPSAGELGAVAVEGLMRASEAESQRAADSIMTGGAVEAVAGAEGAAASAAAEGGADASSSTLYSQYYYQQYAYLYQYAIQQGYGEADAVSYAQYYAATYAQQYEAQAPQGLVGSGASGVEGEAAVAAEAGTPGQQQIEDTSGLAAEPPAPSAADAGFMSVTDIAVQSSEPSWQAAAEAAEDEASTVAVSGAVGRGLEGGVEEGVAADDPVYYAPDVSTAVAACNGAPLMLRNEAEAEGGLEAEADAAVYRAAPLPPDLTAAAAAATQHHQSAVTSAVAAAVAAASAAEHHPYSPGQQARGAHAAPEAAPGHVSSVAAVGPQLLLGLGAAGAKRLTQLSSAATATVASLGATVAATAPVAAALSAATTAAAAAAASMRVESAGLSEDDFERIMHPGDPAKLDGPLPWELPDHLRTGRKFLALCSNWQLANPGLPYAPHMLVEQLQQPTESPGVRPAQLQQQQHEGEAVMAKGGGSDVALAAEGGSGSGGGAVAPIPAGQAPQTSPFVEELSSYERACRLAHFGQPVAGLTPPCPEAASDGHAKLQPQATMQPPAEPMVPGATRKVPEPEGSAVPATEGVASSHSPQQSVPSAGADAAPSAATCAPVTLAPQPLDLGSLPAMDSPTAPSHEQPTPGSARSEDPYAGTEHGPLSEHKRRQPSPLASPIRVSCDGKALGEEELPAPAPAAAVPFAPLGSVETSSFFEHLCDAAAATQPVGILEVAAPVEQAPGDVAVWEEKVAAVQQRAGAQQMSEAVVVEAGSEAVEVSADDVAATSAATLAAAAIDSVVQALEQLRSSAAAANADGASAAVPLDRTSLLLQIHSSLAQATQALAGLGVDVGALTSLAGAAQKEAQEPASPGQWTPGPGSKRARMDDSPSTPTRPVPSAAAENIVTPLLPPGPPMLRTTSIEGAGGEGAPPAAAGPSERFQQLGRRLSDASAEVAAVVAGAKGDAAEGAVAAQQPAVVLSLTVASPPQVDLVAVEERVRGEERSAWEARLGAVVDAEREAAALVIASVEQERDGLQRRVGVLEQQLVAATAERDVLSQRLSETEAGSQEALAAAQAEMEAERGMLAAQLSSVLTERDGLAGELAVERSEKAALASALASARAESEELRQRYAERFSALTSDLEATRGSLTELQAEHDVLLLCLGQESTKVATLADALREAGRDPEPMLERIEAEYETMGLEGADEQPEAEGSSAAAGEEAEEEQGAGDGWEGEDIAL